MRDNGFNVPRDPILEGRCRVRSGMVYWTRSLRTHLSDQSAMALAYDFLMTSQNKPGSSMTCRSSKGASGT